MLEWVSILFFAMLISGFLPTSSCPSMSSVEEKSSIATTSFFFPSVVQTDDLEPKNRADQKALKNHLHHSRWYSNDVFQELRTDESLVSRSFVPKSPSSMSVTMTKPSTSRLTSLYVILRISPSWNSFSLTLTMQLLIYRSLYLPEWPFQQFCHLLFCLV